MSIALFFLPARTQNCFLYGVHVIFLSRLVFHWSFLLCICSRTELGHSGHCELVVDPNAAPLLAARRWPLIVASVPLRSGSIRGSNLLAQALAEELNGLAKIIPAFRIRFRRSRRCYRSVRRAQQAQSPISDVARALNAHAITHARESLYVDKRGMRPLRPPSLFFLTFFRKGCPPRRRHLWSGFPPRWPWLLPPVPALHPRVSAAQRPPSWCFRGCSECP